MICCSPSCTGRRLGAVDECAGWSWSGRGADGYPGTSRLKAALEEQRGARQVAETDKDIPRPLDRRLPVPTLAGSRDLLATGRDLSGSLSRGDDGVRTDHRQAAADDSYSLDRGAPYRGYDPAGSR